jgi:hypothetical protein
MQELTSSKVEYVSIAQRKEARPTKAKQFRDLLMNSELEFPLETHNGITAKIGDEAGFKGLWAGGVDLQRNLTQNGLLFASKHAPAAVA